MLLEIICLTTFGIDFSHEESIKDNYFNHGLGNWSLALNPLEGAFKWILFPLVPCSNQSNPKTHDQRISVTSTFQMMLRGLLHRYFITKSARVSIWLEIITFSSITLGIRDSLKDCPSSTSSIFLVLAGHELPGTSRCLRQEQAQMDTCFRWDTKLQWASVSQCGSSVPPAQRKRSRTENQPCHPRYKYLFGWLVLDRARWGRSEEHETAFTTHLFLGGEWSYIDSLSLSYAGGKQSKAWAHSHRRQWWRVRRKISLWSVSFRT